MPHPSDSAQRPSDKKSWLRSMSARDPHEPHRASTPLECLLDLCFVVAVAQASARLHHALGAGHEGGGALAYAMVFFAVWWAWMNFTWFASAYDNDDVGYRLLVLIEIAGVLVLAAGVPRAFEEEDFQVVTIGYAIMRVGLIGHWLRAFRSDVARRPTILRYLLGLSLLQAGWIGLLLVPAALRIFLMPLLIVAELALPVWAERGGQTAWHAHHIAERFGLMTLIVLGESVLASSEGIQALVESGQVTAPLLGVVVGGLVILFAMWWIYFDTPAHRLLSSNRIAFVWGYGHLLIFSATAAVGAALGVAAEQLSPHETVEEATTHVAGESLALPVAIYLLAVWALHVRPLRRSRVITAAFVVTAALVLLASLSPFPVPLIAALMAALVAVTVIAD